MSTSKSCECCGVVVTIPKGSPAYCQQCWDTIVEPAHQYTDELKPDIPLPFPAWYGYRVREAYIAGAARQLQKGRTVDAQVAADVAPRAVSVNFERAFASGSGGCVRDCDCGRTNYDFANRWDWEDGELEGLIEKAKAEPDRYIGHDCSVSTMDVSGKEIVMGCPCNSARRFEDWIIAHGEQIAEYLNSRANDLEAEASRTRVHVTNQKET